MNEYWTKRHYKETEKIKNAIYVMNGDIKELSKYCDKLERYIKELLEIIEENLDESVIKNTFNMSNKELIDFIHKQIIER